MAISNYVLIVNIITGLLLYSYFLLDDRYNLDWFSSRYDYPALLTMVGTIYYGVLGSIVWLVT